MEQNDGGGDTSAVQGSLKNVRRSSLLAMLLLPFLPMVLS